MTKCGPFPLHRLFHLLEEVLLRPDDAAWPPDAHPPDSLSGREAVVLHQVTPDTCARAAKPRLRGT